MGTASSLKVVPSIRILCIATVIQRARATIARLRPQRFAKRDAHVRSALPRPRFSMTVAASHNARLAAFDFFVEAYGVKWDKAIAKLTNDRDALLAFYDFLVEH